MSVDKNIMLESILGVETAGQARAAARSIETHFQDEDQEELLYSLGRVIALRNIDEVVERQT